MSVSSLIAATHSLTSPRSTRAATYKVFINTMKRLPTTKLDAAFGITGLVSLYAIRWICARVSKRYPSKGLSCSHLGWIAS